MGQSLGIEQYQFLDSDRTNPLDWDQLDCMVKKSSSLLWFDQHLGIALMASPLAPVQISWLGIRGWRNINVGNPHDVIRRLITRFQAWSCMCITHQTSFMTLHLSHTQGWLPKNNGWFLWTFVGDQLAKNLLWTS